jgi:hypothetical protein
MLKKNLLIFLTMMLVIGFSSCQKEGIYHPNQKISTIVEENSFTQWTWDGNLLTEIANANRMSFLTMEYDRKRLSHLIESNGTVYSYNYEGSKLKKVDVTDNGVLIATFKFEHNKNKVSKITMEYFDSKMILSNNPLTTTSLRFMLSSSGIESMMKLLKEAPVAKGGSNITTVEYEWDNHNIKKEVIKYSINGNVSKEEFNYKYDNKNNPYYYSFLQGLGESVAFSKNNITEIENLNGDQIFTTKISYIYNKKDFPEAITTMKKNSTDYTDISSIYIIYDKDTSNVPLILH